ncbi:hypothetical protein [Shigella flexneri]|uniref:hypothetical protein n=1 Tax=Shigella flexneri TaxID=623 RepID=UPI001F1C641C|nr:hypothetical protein [Shigella flexneri]
MVNETTYAKGILPIDTYKKDLDAIANEPLHYDWKHCVNQSKRTACVTPRFLP